MQQPGSGEGRSTQDGGERCATAVVRARPSPSHLIGLTRTYGLFQTSPVGISEHALPHRSGARITNRAMRPTRAGSLSASSLKDFISGHFSRT